MSTLPRVAKKLAEPLAALPLVRSAVAALAGRRRRGLVLLYHRVLPADAFSIVPTVTPETFRSHLRTIRAVGELVRLADLASQRRPSSRVPIAVSFDDDDPSHVDYALPVLREEGATATFFLSGRALQGLSAYWWVHLERGILADGLAAMARLLDLPADLPLIMRTCENDPARTARLETFAEPADRELSTEPAVLAGAGMDIGFHTVRHEPLPTLGDASLSAALNSGCQPLAVEAGAPLTLVAYPYGRADGRVAAAAREAGFAQGFVTGGRPVTPRSDPFLLPRWEPGPLSESELRAALLLRLHRPAATH